jgi:hypothetical protein
MAGLFLLLVSFGALLLSLFPRRSLIEIELVTRESRFVIDVPEVGGGGALTSDDLPLTSMRIVGGVDVDAASHCRPPLPRIRRPTGTLAQAVLEACPDASGFGELADELREIGIEPEFDRLPARLHLLRATDVTIQHERRPTGGVVTLTFDFSAAAEKETVAKVTVASATVARIRGGSTVQVALALAGDVRPKRTSLRVIDLADGSVRQTYPLDLSPPEERLVLPHGNNLLILEEWDEERRSVLAGRDLSVARIRFHREEGLGAVSQIAKGRVHFSEGIRETAEIEPDSFLVFQPEETMVLRSLEIVPEGLRLVMLGNPRNIKLGPNPRFALRLQPTLLQGAFFHFQKERVGLALTSLLTLAGLSMKFFKG